jgi:Ni/Co efflux regulator RcnB
MLRRLGISTMALAAALAAATPAVSLARDRDDHRSGEHHEVYRGHEAGRDRHWDHDRDWDRQGWSFGFGYTAPVPVPAPAPGYYDQYGVWHPYAPYPYGY